MKIRQDIHMTTADSCFLITCSQMSLQGYDEFSLTKFCSSIYTSL